MSNSRNLADLLTSTGDVKSDALDNANSTPSITDGGNETAITIDINENVGIGTSSPRTKLHVTGLTGDDDASLGNSTAPLLVTNTSGSYGLNIGVNNAGTSWLQAQSNTASTAYGISINPLGGNVGIGTSSPSALLHLRDKTANDGPMIRLEGDGKNALGNLLGGIEVHNADSSGDGPQNVCNIKAFSRHSTGRGGYLTFGTNLGDGASEGAEPTERMRIDSAGNVLVGTTDTAVYASSTTGGMVFRNDFKLLGLSRGSNYALSVNRYGTDGTIANFRSNGATVASIGSRNAAYGYFQFGSTGAGIGGTNTHAWLPIVNGLRSDNTTDLGHTSYRFDDLYATNGTIQTSDRNDKQDVDILSVAEQKVAITCKGLMRKFRWKDAVTEKGDDARIHFGIIAQDLQAAFAAEGLDAGAYAMFISGTWYEKEIFVDEVISVEAVEATFDDKGVELTPVIEAIEAKGAYSYVDRKDDPTTGYTERTRLGIRYSELLAFIIVAM